MCHPQEALLSLLPGWLTRVWLTLFQRRTKRRHAEAEGLDEAVAMAGYETAGFSGYHSSAPSDYYGGACGLILLPYTS